MSIQVLWTFLLKFYYVKIIWIFIFVVSSVTTFLLITFGTRKDELHKRMFPDECKNNENPPITNDDFEDKLQCINDHLKQNEQLLVKTKKKITETEEMFENVENFNKHIRNEQKSFFFELRQELTDTEKEIRKLQFDVSNLADRRRLIKENVLKHQQMCEKIVSNCITDFGIFTPP